MGKTAFALNIALHAAKEDISLIFSFEMSKKQLLKRLAGLTGKIDSLKMKNPKREFHDEDWQNFTDAIGKMAKVNLHILIEPEWMSPTFGQRYEKFEGNTEARSGFWW